MEVHLILGSANQLSRMAAAQERATKALVQEAVERLFRHQEWFLREADKGLAAAETDESVSHDDVRRLIDTRYPARLSGAMIFR